MLSTRTLAIAAVAALSLGVGTAMAQNQPAESTNRPVMTYQAGTPNANGGAVQNSMPQSGSADRFIQTDPSMPADAIGYGSGG